MKNIFITGISTGIGYDATRYLLEKGFRVIGSVRKHRDRDRLLNDFSENLSVVIMDVTATEEIAKAVEKTKLILETDKLDVLINNAGIAVPGPQAYLDDDAFFQQINVNVIGVRMVTNAFLPLLGFAEKNDKRKSKIINISSISGLFNVPFNGSYCISKHALESMTDVYRRELYNEGIDVIAIEPGPIKTEIWNKNLGTLQRYEKTHYGEIMKNADQMIKNADAGALPVEVISRLIYKIIISDNSRTRYIVHRKKLLFNIVAKYLPDRWVDKMIWKNFNKGNSYRPV